MWSSSAFVCPSSETDAASIHSIAQYIEDYIDLVENVPNEVIRQITLLHEHNHRYHQLLATLESMWEVIVDSNGSSNDNAAKIENKRKKSLLTIQRCLIEIQEISDEKLFIIQSVLDQLDAKARQLDIDYRSITMANAVNSVASPTKSNAVSVNNVNNSLASGACNDASNAVNSLDNVPSSSENSSKENNAANSGTPITTSPNINNSTSHSSFSNKRSSSRRNLNSGKNADNSNGEISGVSGKRGVKRGVKGHAKDVKRNKSKDIAGNSPPAIYEDTPIDPDEPTYCLCEQVSFGEMICCDNDACQIEWFHFSCVALTTKPKGRWYCPNCRGDRSNIPKK
ncbi:inhibitor of growth protein 1-like protein [Dinothrombium tinctorium]|uniref:Inhibitor of growth protein n=1 Tax=Dinothrombium tinctorium TaxID=1965070 RepID=A0A443RK66_9ACAR|nr:inhibitor of growth protein 1-like protein [Dinothrombium tinctorium]